MQCEPASLPCAPDIPKGQLTACSDCCHEVNIVCSPGTLHTLAPRQLGALRDMRTKHMSVWCVRLPNLGALPACVIRQAKNSDKASKSSAAASGPDTGRRVVGADERGTPGDLQVRPNFAVTMRTFRA